MPQRGRPRLIADRSSATKLFRDDLREIAALVRVGEGRTVSDVIRVLVHEALVIRRQRALGRDEAENHLRRLHQQAVTDGLSPLQNELLAIRAQLGELKSSSQSDRNAAPSAQSLWLPLLTEILGFAMTAEMKTHLLLRHLLPGRGLSEEAVFQALAEQERNARTRTETILRGLLPAGDQS